MSTELGSRAPFTRYRDSIGVAATALVWAIVTAFVAVALQDPPHVNRITVDNPHPWRVHIDVTDADDDGWLGLGAIDRDRESSFHGILDQGEFWILRFSYGGQHAEVHLSRLELERNQWHVTVPEQLASRLRAADVPETPP